MKSGSMLTALLLSVFTLAPSTEAKAQCQHQSSTRTSCCGSCGGQITWVLRVVGYCADGCPIRRWVQLPHCCTPRRPACDHDHDDDHSHGGYSRSSSRRYR